MLPLVIALMEANDISLFQMGSLVRHFGSGCRKWGKEADTYCRNECLLKSALPENNILMMFKDKVSLLNIFFMFFLRS
jgi:hypothetical protein